MLKYLRQHETLTYIVAILVSVVMWVLPSHILFGDDKFFIFLLCMTPLGGYLMLCFVLQLLDFLEDNEKEEPQ